MKKRFVFILLIAIFLMDLRITAVESAASDFVEELGVTAGITTWMATWKQDYFDTGMSPAFGPKIGIAYRRFGFGLLYLQGSFDLDLEGGGSGTGERRDFDLVMQYSLLDYLALGVGYKILSYELDPEDYKVEQTLDGLGLSVIGIYPFGDTGFYSYGTVSYLPSLSVDSEVKIDSQKETDSGDAKGMNFEIGGGYSFLEIPLSIDLGYRYQNMDKDITNDRDTSDRFQGIVLELSLILDELF